MAIIVSTNVASTAGTFNTMKGLGLKDLTLTTKTNPYVLEGGSDNPADTGYCDILEALGSNQFLSNVAYLDKPYYYTGGSIEIFNKTIPESYALNPELWKIINVYKKSDNSNVSVLVPSELYASAGLRVYTQGEPIAIGQFFYFNASDNKCYVYDQTDDDDDHIDRILGVCVLEAIDNQFFGLSYGAINFDGDTYEIGKNYYIGADGYWTSTEPETTGLVKVPIGKAIDINTMYLNIQQPTKL